MKILMVLTSHDKLGNTGRKTGFWLEGGLLFKTSSPKFKTGIQSSQRFGNSQPVSLRGIDLNGITASQRCLKPAVVLPGRAT